MEFLRPIFLLVLTEKCYDEYFINFNFLDVDCFRASLSKGLGIGIIAGSILVKVPQIVKILNSKSGEGISILSVTLDLWAITIAASYSFVNKFPFSAWGDGAFLAIQTVTIAILVLYFAGEKIKSFIYLAAYLGLCFILMGGITPLKILWNLQVVNIPILLMGKFTQAYTNYKNNSTGQLSAATVFLLFFGSVARIFTSIQETGDSMLVVIYCASSGANAVIASQMLYYWNSDKALKQKVKKVK